MKNINTYIFEKLVIDKTSGKETNSVWYKFSSTNQNVCDIVLGDDNLYIEKVQSKTLPEGCYAFFSTKRQILKIKKIVGGSIEGNYRLQEITYSDNIHKLIKWYNGLKWPNDKDKYWKYAKDIKLQDVI